ncbi:MAG: type I DNA topoisomerase [Rhizobiales bacterium]|nr:type I DNA topoisomerase [Hyphomicrobiales bacterium]MBO6698091.1 type I DNA topoisomerase [Hyphomicrobiales bacterium]MBO6735655.1 type I DNA topoisomerase [Hyphomicrobiales bacterium]MBO6910537.1 type I DNA topoisomerase [Hyphomicrobiales bacterium]
MDLVIVESPAKAKTINKYLGPNYKVLASMGHVRDLPSKDGSVDPEDDFAMRWQNDAGKSKTINDIARSVKEADRVILATDPDREGEAISWHVLEILKAKKVLKDKPVERVVFNAITKSAVLEAMENPRAIDGPLVDAYLARRALDYLVGFTLSPVLWRKLPGSRSAGRVQSVALRLVTERETEIEAFVPKAYWTITAHLKNGSNAPFEARLASYDGTKYGRHDLTDANLAGSIKSMLEQADISVAKVEAKPVRRNPYAPFTTSTLQQDASSRLGMSPSVTMRIAQRLYEGTEINGETVGLITYMRTDGVQMAPEAIRSTRKLIGEKFGAKYLPDSPRLYSSKAKNAQEAHEAIRPTELSRTPEDVSRYLDADQAKLYRLIWARTMASQMAASVSERTSVDLVASQGGHTAELRASGSVITFDGFLAAYDVGTSSKDDDDKRLPAITERDKITHETIEAIEKFTEPPARFSEASLVKRMEELGIGRPSTYAATLAVLQDRDYIEVEKRRIFAKDKGRLVTAFLEAFFKRYVEYDFTASLEEELDKISAGERDWRDVLRAFWTAFSASVDEISELRITQVIDALNDLLGPHIFPDKGDGSDPRKCPACEDGQLSLKISRYGAFIGCSNYPECNYTRQLAANDNDGEAQSGPIVLGEDTETGEQITLRDGRFGPYVQLGEAPKPKRASLPKGWDRGAMDLEKALRLLSLPRLVGAHPESGKDIVAGIGRYGPFVLHEGMYANLDSVDEVFEVGLNRAVTVLAEKAAGGGGRGRSAPQALKTLGDHPEGGAVTVHSGRYGPYVKHGKINATIPKDTKPEDVTMEQAIELIAARAAKAGKKPAAKKKAPTKKKTTAKKATAKKPAKKAASAE